MQTLQGEPGEIGPLGKPGPVGPPGLDGYDALPAPPGQAVNMSTRPSLGYLDFLDKMRIICTLFC